MADRSEDSGARARMQLFDLNTMSGISPGIRTRIMQRVYLLPTTTETSPCWIRLLWYAGPESTDQAASIQDATCRVQQQAEAGDNRWQPDPLLTIDHVDSATINHILQTTLAARDYVPLVCGACTHWQATGARTEDGLPLGRCTLPAQAVGRTEVPAILSRQSMLAPGCARWEQVAGRVSPTPDNKETTEKDAELTLPRAAVLVKEEEARTAGFWSRLRRALGSPKRMTEPGNALEEWHARLEERSGVGAGTEPCFACQGRLANLGALTVATDEDDKHTYSVWRCRICHTTYLNSWIDRWERLDNLETEEIYYRLAPAQAVEALAVIDGVIGGEHPAGRAQRGAERNWFAEFTADLPILSHQRKQGR